MKDLCGAKPAGLDAYETLRIEAGSPVYGIDVDENRFVMEVARPLRADPEQAEATMFTF